MTDTHSSLQNSEEEDQTHDTLNVNMKLSLCLTKHHVMKTQGRIEVQFHALLTSALDGDERSASRSGHFIPGERAADIH